MDPVVVFKVKPGITLTGLNTTFTPGIAWVPPLMVSLPVTGALGVPGITVAVSFTASIVGGTVITAVAVSHTIGVAVTVQI